MESQVPVEVFVPPSREADRLKRLLPDLVDPADGRGSLPARAGRAFLVAPFTQLTFVSFDLQAFLFDVFHTTWIARVGHFVGMAGVNFFLMVATGALAGPAGVLAYGGLLLGWYAVVARAARLPGWWLATVPMVAALAAGAMAWPALTVGAPGWLAAPWVGLLASGAVISFSHAPEPWFPPRAGDPVRWTTVAGFIRGEGAEAAKGRWRRLLRVAAFPFIGIVDELWAAPRLLPYNLLRVMLALGYAPALKAELDSRAQRAIASGQPALDFVGIGGGVFLDANGTPKVPAT